MEEYQSTSPDSVPEEEMANIIKHYKRLGKNEDSYIKSFDEIAAQYTDTQLRIITKFLPLNVRAVLEEKSPKYQQIMSFNNSVTNNILQSIDYLKSGVIDYEFRTTLVDELHNEITIEKMGKLIKDAKIIYLQHFIDHGTCIKQGLHAVEKEKALEYKCLLEKYVTNVRLRGY